MSQRSLQRAGDLAVGLALCGYVIGAAVGLPLFEDGSLYLFVIATEHAPELPNLRVTGVLPQLPAVVAFALGADLVWGRFVFSVSYSAIPLLSLLGCWWLLRARAPALLLVVLPTFLALQLNFSGVSELLIGVYLTWPILLAMVLALWMLHRCRRGAMQSRLLLLVLWLALLSACWVSAEVMHGQGIILKSAITVGVGLLGMAAVTLLVLRRKADQRAACTGVPSTAVRLAGVALLTLLLAKSSAWWAATRGLQDIVASSDMDCIRFAADEPYSLQWPWMAIIDAWSTPMTALVTRPFVPLSTGPGSQPIAILLQHDGCALLQATGMARLPADTRIPFDRLDAAFGPLRRAEPLPR